MFLFFKGRVLFLFFLWIFTLQPGQAAWRQELESINTQRESLFKEQHPGFVIKPLSEQAVEIVGGRKYGIDYSRSATPDERKVIYTSLIQTAIMHPRDQFFEYSSYAPKEEAIRDPLYYGHLTVCYIIDTATRILEDPNGITAVFELAQTLFSYFQVVLSYKETALRLFGISDEQASNVLQTLETYTQTRYQSLLTDQFINWYQAVNASAPEERIKYGMRMDVLPPLFSPSLAGKNASEVNLPCGVTAIYNDQGRLIGFRTAWEVYVPINFSPNCKGKIFTLQGHCFDSGENIPSGFSSPLGYVETVSTLKKALLNVRLETLYHAHRFHPTYELRLSSSDQIVEDCRDALALSDVYKLFGHKAASRNVLGIENILGERFYERVEQDKSTIPHRDKIAILNASLDLLEHKLQTEKLWVQKTDSEACFRLNNWIRSLNLYGNYLHEYFVSSKDKLSLDECIFLLRRSIALSKRAEINDPFFPPDQKREISHAEIDLGITLAQKAHEVTLSHKERVDLFEESLLLLGSESSLPNVGFDFHREAALDPLEKTCSDYGVYLHDYSWLNGSLAIGESIFLLKKSTNLFKKAYSNGNDALQKFLVAESHLGVVLANKSAAPMGASIVETTPFYQKLEPTDSTTLSDIFLNSGARQSFFTVLSHEANSTLALISKWHRMMRNFEQKALTFTQKNLPTAQDMRALRDNFPNLRFVRFKGISFTEETYLEVFARLISARNPIRFSFDKCTIDVPDMQLRRVDVFHMLEAAHTDKFKLALGHYECEVDVFSGSKADTNSGLSWNRDYSCEVWRPESPFSLLRSFPSVLDRFPASFFSQVYTTVHRVVIHHESTTLPH